jgi:uncharacterized protein YndB with AHSA1/START domain
MEHEKLDTSSDLEITSTRTFNVAKELLFKAWSDPNHLKNWWGPAGFTNTFIEFDFRVGGKWNFIMHGPEKGNYHNECEFIKIEEPSIIEWKRHSKPYFNVLSTFEANTETQTKLVFKMIFETEEECRKIKVFAVEKNEENFDKLELELEKMK